MKNLVGFLILIIGLGSISAQSYNKQFTVSQNQVQNFSSSDTLRILAVMVDFQEDKYDATIGTGKFGSHYSKVYGDTILDPLPHNAEYFADHLLFAKNYFSKVSRGKLNIAYKVLPEVITVSQTMREYVPGYQSKDLSPLGKFSEEVWKLADQKFSNVKFSDYNLFIIFHAGVSSGLDLGTFSIDRNMPSLYLSNSSLKTIFGTGFSGFVTKSGAIKNTLIMPETESREQTYIDNSVGLLQITINGALVANIGSHLGLPDLFDTETGKSAIGRFGLMDGQAIVANYGMFPPELSAWEKMYLGWEEPKEVSLAGGKISVATKIKATAADTIVAKIPISSSEYYLVENRQQDANKDDLILTIKKGNQIYKKTIQPDTSGLFNFDPTSIKGGVVVDVDEFDAAVPGKGIVIWHIDENVINAKIADNKINSDLTNKGVDVEEADGIQDIGETFSSIFGSFIGEGTEEDFWFKGNKAKFYKNSFSPSSKPNTNSNSGSNSLITIDGFTENSSKMSFNVQYQNGALSLLNRSILEKIKTPGSIVFHKSNPWGNVEFQYVSIKDGSDLYTYSIDGRLISKNIGGVDFDIAVANYVSDHLMTVVIGVKNKFVFALKEGYSWGRGANLQSIISSSPVINYIDNNTFILVGSTDGTISTINYKYMLNFSIPDSIVTTKITNEPIRQIVAKNKKIAAISSTQLIDFDGNKTVFPDSTVMFSVVQFNDGKYSNVVLTKKNKFYVVQEGKAIASFVSNSTKIINSFSISDIQNNGNPSILFNDGNEIKAYTLCGVMVEDFPITSPNKLDFSTTPITSDVSGDGFSDIISTTADGNVYCFDGKNKTSLFTTKLSGEPSVSTLLVNYDTIADNAITKNVSALIGLDKNNQLTVYSVSADTLKNSWNSKFYRFSNNSIVNVSTKEKSTSDFFPTTKAYNWPNPVYGSSTKIRYYVAENSTATVKIFDLSGELVTTLTGNATGGMDNEIEWQIGKVQSGVYYANLEVVSSSGKSANKIIKIAVIK